jgi:hypothetical protein
VFSSDCSQLTKQLLSLSGSTAPSIVKRPKKRSPKEKITLPRLTGKRFLKAKITTNPVTIGLAAYSSIIEGKDLRRKCGTDGSTLRHTHRLPKG